MLAHPVLINLSQDKLNYLHQSEHQRLDVEMASLEAALAKNVRDGNSQQETQSEVKSNISSPESTKNEGNQSASIKDGRQPIESDQSEASSTVTTTVIGKPDWGEADSTSASVDADQKHDIEKSNNQ